MPVYFIGQNDFNGFSTKVGVAKNIERRRIDLQTGNPVPLALMGWICSDDDFGMERRIHDRFAVRRIRGEWFNIDPADILPMLMLAGRNGFVAKNADAFKVIGFDKDAVPEYLGVWKWGDLEFEECCPYCGCFCGMHYQEASCMHHCSNCDTLTDFSDLSPSGP